MKGWNEKMRLGKHLRCRRVLAGGLVAVLALCLSACGAEGPKSKREADSPGEKSVPKDRNAEKKDQRRESFFRKLRMLSDTYETCVVTEHCTYEAVEGYEQKDDVILQKNLQGKELARHKLAFDDFFLLGGSDKRLLYTRNGMNPKGKWEYDIYQIPIRQEGEGEALLVDQAEKLVGTNDIDCQVYLQEPYLVYCDGKAVVRLDLESGDKKKLSAGKETYNVKFVDVASEDGILFLHYSLDGDYYNDYPLLKGEEDTVYRIDIEKWQMEKIWVNEELHDEYRVMSAGSDLLIEQMVESGDLELDSIKLECYDIAKKKKICSVSKTEIERFLDREGLGKKGKERPELNIEGAYCYSGRVYVDCHLLYFDEGREEESKGGDGEKPLLLSEDDMIQRLVSFPLGEPSKLRYEKDVMDRWYDYVMKLQGDDGNAVYSDGIFAAFENAFYFSCKEKEGRSHIVAYDLDDGEMRELGEEELAYQVLSPLSGYVSMDMNNTQGGFD